MKKILTGIVAVTLLISLSGCLNFNSTPTEGTGDVATDEIVTGTVTPEEIIVEPTPTEVIDAEVVMTGDAIAPEATGTIDQPAVEVNAEVNADEAATIEATTETGSAQ